MDKPVSSLLFRASELKWFSIIKFKIWFIRYQNQHYTLAPPFSWPCSFKTQQFFRDCWLKRSYNGSVVRRPLVLMAPPAMTCSAPCSWWTPIVQVYFHRSCRCSCCCCCFLWFNCIFSPYIFTIVNVKQRTTAPNTVSCDIGSCPYCLWLIFSKLNAQGIDISY